MHHSILLPPSLLGSSLRGKRGFRNLPLQQLRQPRLSPSPTMLPLLLLGKALPPPSLSVMLSSPWCLRLVPQEPRICRLVLLLVPQEPQACCLVLLLLLVPSLVVHQCLAMLMSVFFQELVLRELQASWLVLLLLAMLPPVFFWELASLLLICHVNLTLMVLTFLPCWPHLFVFIHCIMGVLFPFAPSQWSVQSGLPPSPWRGLCFIGCLLLWGASSKFSRVPLC